MLIKIASNTFKTFQKFIYKNSQNGSPPTASFGFNWLLPEKWVQMSWLSLVIKCQASNVYKNEKQLNVQVKQSNAGNCALKVKSHRASRENLEKEHRWLEKKPWRRLLWTHLCEEAISLLCEKSKWRRKQNINKIARMKIQEMWSWQDVGKRFRENCN